MIRNIGVIDMATVKISNNQFQIECDNCKFRTDDRSDIYKGDQFVAMNSAWKRKGGVTAKYKGEFVNWCDGCAAEKEREMIMSGTFCYPHYSGRS